MKRWVAFGLLGLTACSTTYTPRPSPRVHLAISGGSMVLMRDGQEFGLGPLGGVSDALVGVPEAHDHAETYESFTLAGFVVGIAGAVASGAGAGIFLADSIDRGGSPSTTATGIALGLVIGGLGAAIVGASFQLAAQPHLFDAINIYNDSVGDGFVPPPPLYAPPPPWPTPAAPPPAEPRTEPAREPAGEPTGEPAGEPTGEPATDAE
jgi:hypothetical protein